LSRSRKHFHKSALSAKYSGLPPRGIPTRLEAVSERLHGTLGQAFQFAGRLNRARDVIYSTTMVADEEAQELGLDGTEAFSLTHALAKEG
jgi:hypothetical protein